MIQRLNEMIKDEKIKWYINDKIKWYKNKKNDIKMRK